MMTAVRARAEASDLSVRHTCPFCASTLNPYVQRPASVYATGSPYDVHRCEGCHCGVTVPTPTAESIASTYGGTYDYDAHTLIAPEKKWRARRILHRVCVEPTSSLLDVGCMYGYLLQEAKKQGISRVEGVELAGAPVAWARRQGSTVFQGTLEEYAATQPGQFDVIIAQHILEHIADVDGFLHAAFSLLRPRGRLVVCVPHFGARTQRLFKQSWGWYQLPAHVFHFTPAALRLLGERHQAETLEMAFKGGDSLFVLLTLLYTVSGSPRQASRITGFKKAAIALASLALRPYYYMGDEEIVAVFRKPGVPDRAA
jgi:SAM-dependent methyltransferase